MATLPPFEAKDSKATQLLRGIPFGRARLVSLAILTAILAACMVFTWTTRDAMLNLPFLSKQPESRQAESATAATAQKSVVDRTPWQTAEALAALAVSAEERNYSSEALRLADHEVDQAFAFALRQPTVQAKNLTGEALAVSQKVDQVEQLVKDDQAQIKSLTPNGVAPDPASDEADDLELAKAQLSLDTDVLNDAQDQLAAATGDQRPQIQQELAAHEAGMAKYDAKAKTGGDVALIAVQRYSTLASRISAWVAQRSRHNLLLQARKQALADATTFAAQNAVLEAQADKLPSSTTPGLDARRAHLEQIKQQSQFHQLANIASDRLSASRQLAVIYEKWAAQVELQHRIVLHLILQSIALIAFILICVIAATSLIHHFMQRSIQARHIPAERPDADNSDPRHAATLKTILQIGTQILGIFLILLVIFGIPRQISTILGLFTAGLTVALQDFIIAFLGWFVLMGKHGIRVGDAIEINGVAGEVTDLGLFRTTILETGNTTEAGHPTGRRVAFLNKFAVNGQYFNFSTIGQWMWDEITITVPDSPSDSQNAYSKIAQIHKAVLKATEKSAQAAEQEWRRNSRLHGLAQFGASAQVNVRPAASGINLLIRYVTRAADRFETRNLIYQSVIEVLHQPAEQNPSGNPLVEST